MFKKKRALIFCSALILLFGALMIYALKQNPNFTPSTLVGRKVPVFKGQTTEGENFDSQEVFNKKQWVILNFWSSSCYVCRDEAPELENFYQSAVLNKSDNSINPSFISINIEDDADVIIEWKRNYSLTFPVLQDTMGLISVSFGVTGTPETFFVDPAGVVRYRLAGEVNKKNILSLIDWLSLHPNATENEVTKQLISFR